jgi:TRAP-type transport system periplasmic protein
MLRRFWMATCILMTVVLISGCAGMPGQGGATRVQLKIASGTPEADIGSQVLKFWGDQVNQKTNGRITQQYFWAGSLLGTNDLYNGLRDGVADVGNVATASISGSIVDVAVLEVPFAYPLDTESMNAVQDQVDPIIDRDVWQKNGLKHVFTATTLVGNPVTCKDKFLDGPDAWRGALVRTAGRWQAATLQNWGASPVVIPLNELYTALQRGTVDCTLLVYNLLESFRIYEVGKFVTRIDHSINYSPFVINQKVWDSLSKEDQQIMIEAGKEARLLSDRLRADATVKAIDTFKANGVRICTPSAQELRRLRDGADQVWEAIARESGSTGKEIMDVLRKYREKVATAPTEGDTTPCSGVR